MTYRDHFFKYLAQTSSFPLALEIEKAEGIYMYGTDGREYIDMISGISVSAVGHRHPDVVAAMKEQLDHHLHLMVYGELIQPPQINLACLLTGHLPATLNNVYLVNSGSEAIEGALKLAKRYTRRTEVVAFKDAYHGSSHGALSITGREAIKQSFRPLLPDMRHIVFNDPGMLDQITKRTACVVAETIQGEAGAVVPGKNFMQALRQRCYDTGALLILDEIQAGMGRTGELWAFSHFDIEPDILTLAKGFGGGMPLGAFIASREMMRCLTERPVLGHITTFGGNALCSAAAKATLQTIIGKRLWENAVRQEKTIRKHLIHNDILKIRGKGLLLAVEFDSADRCKKIIDRCLERGLLTDWFLFADHCMRIAPPLTITSEEVEKACAVILQAVEDVAG